MYTANMNAMSATAAISKKSIFTFDHVNHKIVGTDVNFQKAGIPGSREEKVLMNRIATQPTYGYAVIETEKKPAKQTYAGLTMGLMESYLEIYKGELAAEMRIEFAKMKGKHDAKEMAYSTIKSWFLDLFPHFNVNKAKTDIKAAKLAAAKAPHKVIKVSLAIAQPVNK